MKTIALLSGSALAGMCLGLVVDLSAKQGGAPAAKPMVDSEVSGNASVEEAGSAALPGRSESESFAVLPFEQQREIVFKWGVRPAHLRTCGEEREMLRAVQSLGHEQTVALLDVVSSASAVKGDSLEFVRITLKERLAAQDPKLALEMGRQRNDAELRSAAVLASIAKNAAEGLRLLAQLPEAERYGVWSLAKGNEKAGGSLAELATLIKEVPELTKSRGMETGVEGCVAWLAARRMAVDPEGGLAEMRQIIAALRTARASADPNGQGTSDGDPSARVLTMGAISELQELSPEAARRVFDSLGEGEKNGFLVSMEASARLRELGADAAIRFAEAQSSEESFKEAARGLWRGLVQQDRSSALQWLESLPAGPFRRGVIDGVRYEAALRNRSSGSGSLYLQAGAELLSRETQLEYYASIVSKNKSASIDVIAPSELISSLPISDVDKQELRRRVAPVKPK